MIARKLIKEAREIVKSHPCPCKTSPAQYRDYLIPELFERNISDLPVSLLGDAILAAELITGKKFTHAPKEIIRYINKSVNYN